MPIMAYAFRPYTKGTLSLGALARERFPEEIAEDQPRGLSLRAGTLCILDEERRPVRRLQGAPCQPPSSQRSSLCDIRGSTFFQPLTSEMPSTGQEFKYAQSGRNVASWQLPRPDSRR